MLVGKRESRRPHGIPRYRWEDNIKIGVKRIMLELAVDYPFGPGNGHLNSSTSFRQNVNILRTKKGNVMKYTTFCRGIN